MSPAASRSPADAPGIVALDRLALRLAEAAPLRVARADGDELEAVLDLRRAFVVSHGWGEPDVPEQHTVELAAWDGGALVGTIRLVLPAPGRLLPVEDEFSLVVEPQGRVVEVGRLLIAEGFRGDPAHAAWGALFAHSWFEIRARGMAVMAGAAAPGLVDRYRALGLPFEILGPARVHRGTERHPVRLDPAQITAATWYG
jgi:hypothetical protein